MSALHRFFDETDLEHSLLVGYYGGGNYGDELLLEVILNVIDTKQYKNLSIAYQNPRTYPQYHHDFGHKLVDMSKPWQLLRKLVASRTIVVGGGGLWGMDTNFKTFGLSALVWMSRYLLFKKVYLIGVGYYGSAARLGHLSAWLAGKAANTIIVRDDESAEHFGQVHDNVLQDQDIAWLAASIPAAAYQKEVEQIEKIAPVTDKSLFIALRHFRGQQAEEYHKQIGTFIESNQDKPVIVALLQPADTYPDGQRLLLLWQQLYPNVHALEVSGNPLGLYFFMQKHQHKLAMIAPQFHAIITAHLNQILFFPLVYDNKVSQLLTQLKFKTSVPIENLRQTELQQFTDTFYEGNAA